MRTATFVVNPYAGRKPGIAGYEALFRDVLRRNEVDAHFVQSSPDPAETAGLARGASTQSEIVIACGGDGTVHHVLEGVAHSRAALGVLPLGTANALARNLGLSLDPVIALEQLLTASPVRIPLGRAGFDDRSTWFAVMAGAGPDGALIQQMAVGAKSRFGRSAYYLEAARLFATRQFATFQVTYRKVGSQEWIEAEVAGVLAARIPDLGGAFRYLTPSAGLLDAHLHLQLLLPPAHLSYAAWMLLRTHSPWLQMIDVDELIGTPLDGKGASVHCQVDAEPGGELPLRLTVVPDALTLLMPTH